MSYSKDMNEARRPQTRGRLLQEEQEGIRGYIVVQRPANEIKERLTMLALDDSAF